MHPSILSLEFELLHQPIQRTHLILSLHSDSVQSLHLFCSSRCPKVNLKPTASQTTVHKYQDLKTIIISL